MFYFRLSVSTFQNKKISLQVCQVGLAKWIVDDTCLEFHFDSRGRLTVTVVVRRSVHLSVPTFQKIAKQNKVQEKIVIVTGGTKNLAEWIIDD